MLAVNYKNFGFKDFNCIDNYDGYHWIDIIIESHNYTEQVGAVHLGDILKMHFNLPIIPGCNSFIFNRFNSKVENYTANYSYCFLCSHEVMVDIRNTIKDL